MHKRVVELLTVIGFTMAGVCFFWFWQTSLVPVLLLALVTFGMSYDFLSHVLGARVPAAEHPAAHHAQANTVDAL